MMRTIYKDPDRYKVYWNTIPNCYTAGDVCRKDRTATCGSWDVPTTSLRWRATASARRRG